VRWLSTKGADLPGGRQARNWLAFVRVSDDTWRIEREKNWNALVQSEGWKLFILQLKKEGRYRK
jgi:hypothetical protein